MADPDFRFGPFTVDRTRYRVLRGDRALELTPKLLDLLLYLLDHAGALVTKEQLLDALWPEANVTDNALAQAMSELREALGDNAGTPQYIKTVTRRGYRLIAPVTRLDAVAAPPPPAPEAREPFIAVMDFTNVSGESDSAWLSSGIAETVTADLRTLGRYRVVDRGRVMEAGRQTNGSMHEIAARVGARFAVVGSYQRSADRIRITARIVNLESGEAAADAKVDGLLVDIFALQDLIVSQFAKELGTSPATRRAASRETASLEAYRAYTEAWLHLETLDLREIPQAIAAFEKAIQIDPQYALALTGLASAELAAYEATRFDTVPAAPLLDAATRHAREAVAIDDSLAEAQAALGFVLVSAWRTEEAVRVARRAVALEPTNWRHFFRLGHASWGDERLRAAANTLQLYPDFAFAHFQMAMVHVARGDLREAETVLRQGAAVQDRQVARGDRYPALGLHWLLGLVRQAQDDVDEAVQEFDRERQRADRHRLYGREYELSAIHARGACLLAIGRNTDAAACFEEALALYPEHAQSHIGLSLARRSASSRDRAGEIQSKLARTRPVEAALVEAQILAGDGQPDAACATLGALLESAPPGFAGWTLPIEPLLRQLHGTAAFAGVLRRLGARGV